LALLLWSFQRSTPRIWLSTGVSIILQRSQPCRMDARESTFSSNPSVCAGSVERAAHGDIPDHAAALALAEQQPHRHNEASGSVDRRKYNPSSSPGHVLRNMHGVASSTITDKSANRAAPTLDAQQGRIQGWRRALSSFNALTLDRSAATARLQNTILQRYLSHSGPRYLISTLPAFSPLHQSTKALPVDLLTRQATGRLGALQRSPPARR